MQDLFIVFNVGKCTLPLMILLFIMMFLLVTLLILSRVHCISLVATECLPFQSGVSSVSSVQYL